jgi:acetylornithine deacetylase/succinyl-diaminopimelate desuccinylase-like protein
MPWTKTTRGSRPQLHSFPGATLEVVRLPGRTPLLFMDVPGDSGDTVLLYGHLDKQPEMKGWSEGLGPWLPVRKDDKLHGRGGADDGYAISPVARHAALIRARGARGAPGGQPIGVAPVG